MSQSDTPKFQFVGASEGTSTDRISWPLEAQAIVIRNNVVGGLGASAAFANGVQEYNDLLDSGELQGDRLPEELPPSYTNKNAGSVLYGMKQRFLKRVNDPKARGHDDSVAAAIQFGIIQPTPDSVDDSADDDGSSEE